MKHPLKTIIVFSLFALCSLLFTPPTIRAFTMNSNQYYIKWGNINIGATGQANGSYKLSTTIGQAAAGKLKQFDDLGYVVSAGFQYWHAIIPFSFSVSKTRIDLGTLLANTPVTDTTDLSVSFGGAGNYQVTAAEETQFKTIDGGIIPNTNCNGGCTISAAGVWNSTTAYGFGYMMSGDDIPDDFTQAPCSVNCYRPFADQSSGQNPVVVMSNQNVTLLSPDTTPKDIIHQSTMTFQANIQPGQAGGSYGTVIHFVATPTI